MRQVETENRYHVLQNPQETNEAAKGQELKKTVKGGMKRSAKYTTRKKITIIGDSQVRGIAAEIKHELGETAKVTGYVSSGSRLETILNRASNEIKVLNKKDTLVIWGGTNDIAINESDKGLTCLFNFVKRCKRTNVVVVSAPKRYNLEETSCVNKEVNHFNRKLHKKLKVFEHAKVIDSVSQRDCFTRHELHLNKFGKEQIAHRIIHKINDSLLVTYTPPIALPWKNMPLDQNLKNPALQCSVKELRTSVPRNKDLEMINKQTEQTHEANILKETPKDPEDPQENEPPTTPNNPTNDASVGTVPEATGSSQTLEETHSKYGNPALITSAALTQAPIRTSSRVRKTPYAMNADFLWTTGPLTRVCH
jgi:hypothetical protein